MKERIKAVVLIFVIITIFSSCRNNNSPSNEAPKIIWADTICSCPQSVINLLPYDDFSKEEVESLLLILQKSFDKWLYGSWTFEIMEPAHLPQHSYVLLLSFLK